MGLKLLHAADLHLDSPFASLPEPDRQQLRSIQRRLPTHLANLCRREGCNMVLLAGDIFDGEPTQESLDALHTALLQCRVPVFLAPGNHDFYGPDSPWLIRSWPDNVHIFRDTWETVDLPELETRVYGAGYRSVNCPALLKGFRAAGDFRYHIGVLHGDPIFASSSYCPVTAEQVRQSGLTYLALGHIHRCGSFQAGSTLCGWPGCTMGRGWDETGDRGVYLVELADTARIRPVILPVPRFQSLTVSARGDWTAALEAALPPTASPDRFRVTLTGAGVPDLPALRRRFSHLSHLELLDETVAPTDFSQVGDEDSLRGVYFRLLRERLAGASPQEVDTIALVAEISQQLLSGREVPLP